MRTLSLEQSVALIPDGASLMIGGFMAVGTPERLIDEILCQGKRDLTVSANDTAMPGKGIGKLVESRLLRKVVVSHIGLNPETQRQMMAGELEVELVLQGTLVARRDPLPCCRWSGISSRDWSKTSSPRSHALPHPIAPEPRPPCLAFSGGRRYISRYEPRGEPQGGFEDRDDAPEPDREQHAAGQCVVRAENAPA